MQAIINTSSCKDHSLLSKVLFSMNLPDPDVADLQINWPLMNKKKICVSVCVSGGTREEALKPTEGCW